MSRQVSPSITRLVGAPFSTTSYKGEDFFITIPFTKLNYVLSKKSGKGVIFYDDTYEYLKLLNFKDFHERRDQLLFTGQVKETGVGYRYGRKTFYELATMDKGKPPDFVSNTKAPYYSFAEQAEYKFILSLRGAGAWTFYCMYGFLLGSLIFCQSAPQELWYYDQFKPMLHYVPVQEDLSDITQKLNWARENPEKAAAIAAEGRILALEIFDPKVVLNEFKNRIVQGVMKEKVDRKNVSDDMCSLSIVQFCKGPEVCKDCFPINS